MLLDSNLIIYSSQPEHGVLRRFIAEEAPYVSVISKVETLGDPEHGENEKQFLVHLPTSSKRVEAPLVNCQVPLAGTPSLSLESAVHSFVTSILQ